MSHHYSGPDFGFPHGDARLDFTDLYAFPKPGDASKSILIMDVHPSVGVNPQGPSTDVAFSPSASLGCLAVLIPRTRESASVIRRARTSTNVAEGDHEAGVGQHLAEQVALGAHDAAPSQQDGSDHRGRRRLPARHLPYEGSSRHDRSPYLR